MTIDTRYAPPTIPLGLEGSLEAMLLSLDAAAADADDAERLANHERFEAAAEALEHRRDEARFKAVGSILSGASQLAEGITGTLEAATRASTTETPGGTPPTSDTPAGSGLHDATTRDAPSLATRLGTGAIDDALGIGASIGSIGASRADLAADGATLDSQRAEVRARESDERSDRDRMTREGLLRRLDELLRSEREAEMRIASGGR